jgi:hypothetical protein
MMLLTQHAPQYRTQRVPECDLVALWQQQTVMLSAFPPLPNRRASSLSSADRPLVKADRSFAESNLYHRAQRQNQLYHFHLQA